MKQKIIPHNTPSIMLMIEQKATKALQGCKATKGLTGKEGAHYVVIIARA